MSEKVLALIPARGGSKRLKNKNILSLGGKPLIAHTIGAALKSKYIDRVIVSTDCEEISAVSQEYGAEVPFLRSDALATDEASSVDVVIDAVSKLEDSGANLKQIILLQPTSPLRKPAHIDEAFESFINKNADAVISVTDCEHSPLWSSALGENGSMEEFYLKRASLKRSQDLPLYVRLNGAIYIIDKELLLKKKSFLPSKNTFAYLMSKESSVDIDDKFDFEFAKYLLQNQQQKEK